MKISMLAAGAVALAAATVAQADLYEVSINGEVEFNQISGGGLGSINVGESISYSFLVDSDLFVNGSFPVRGYEVDQSSFKLSASGGYSGGLASPYPGTPYFVLRNNDPAVDGFFLTTDNVDGFPAGVATDEVGGFGDFTAQFSVGYTGSTLDSLDIADAVGSYDFTGISSFYFAITDGPFDAMGMIFSDMTITAVPAPAAFCLLAPLAFAGRRRRD